MKRYIKCNSAGKWDEGLSSSDVTAVEFARSYMDQGYSMKEAVNRACEDVSWGNAEPEYEDEDFYMDEPDRKKVMRAVEMLMSN